MTRISLASIGKKAIGIIVGLLAFALAQEIVHSFRVSREAPSSPLEREMYRALDRLDVRSELETALQNIDVPFAEGYGTQLSRLGIRRLDVEHLLSRVRILKKLYDAASLDVCAAWTLGNVSPDQVMPLLESLDSASLATWAEMSVLAMAAELRGSPPPFTAADEDVTAAFDEISSSLSTLESERFWNVLEGIDSASVSDVCWFGRTMYTVAASLPVARRGKVLKVLAALEGS